MDWGFRMNCSCSLSLRLPWNIINIRVNEKKTGTYILLITENKNVVCVSELFHGKSDEWYTKFALTFGLHWHKTKKKTKRITNIVQYKWWLCLPALTHAVLFTKYIQWWIGKPSWRMSKRVSKPRKRKQITKLPSVDCSVQFMRISYIENNNKNCRAWRNIAKTNCELKKKQWSPQKLKSENELASINAHHFFLFLFVLWSAIIWYRLWAPVLHRITGCDANAHQRKCIRWCQQCRVGGSGSKYAKKKNNHLNNGTWDI